MYCMAPLMMDAVTSPDISVPMVARKAIVEIGGTVTEMLAESIVPIVPMYAVFPGNWIVPIVAIAVMGGTLTVMLADSIVPIVATRGTSPPPPCTKPDTRRSPALRARRYKKNNAYLTA